MNKTKRDFGGTWIPSIPIFAVHIWWTKNVATAGSQGTFDLTKYCGKQVWWFDSKCGQTAMSALSPGGKVVESVHSLQYTHCLGTFLLNLLYH